MWVKRIEVIATMCESFPLNRRILIKEEARVCIKMPFKEDRIITDFYNLIPKKEILIDHSSMNKKDLNDRFKRPG